MPALLEKPDTRKELSDPFRWFDRMRDEIDRLFETNVARLPLVSRATAAFMPTIEVFETNGELHVNADLPGLKKDDIKLEATPDGLTLTGERKAETTKERDGYFRSERTYGAFYRFVPLPQNADIETMTARFTDGVLRIVVPVPKIEAVKARTVDIK